MNVPPLRATQRLQLHKGFTLDDAVPWVPYFAQLGISHVYASPLLAARAGSLHGYDVVDPTTVNPELGGEPALRRLVAALREHGMGLILDIVSNHMAVGGADNPWWLDLLEWGRLSPYSEFFDVQWHSPDPLLKGQLLMPFLGSDYGEALQTGSLTLHFDASQGAFYVKHYEHRFPICPRDYALILGTDEWLKPLGERFSALAYQDDAYTEAAWLKQALAERATEGEVLRAIEHRLAAFDGRRPEGFKRLHQLLEQQTYRLASWRTAADDINWRRFFDVNELGGLRVERSAVFEATHGKIFALISDGLVDGLRIDHVDGLADPRGYCRKLRRRVDALLPERHVPIFVEKILGDGECLREDWQVDGTTGYEFMNQLSLLQHDPDGFAPLANLWNRHSERPAAFIEEAWLARQQILNGSLAGDFESVAQALLQVARDDVMTRDLTLGAIRRALQELIVHFPVYRTYISACGRSERDDVFFLQALAGARSTLSEGDWPVLDHLEKWLGGQPWRHRPVGRERKMLKHACVRFQQLTSPAAAKAVEDTALYRSAVLLSRNDVGFNTEQFSAPLADFHRLNQQRLQTFPDNLLATATHDHKRGEDTRARLAVLSECAPWYVEQVEQWRTLAAPLRDDAQSPSAGDELILYQVLLGSWPLDLDPDFEGYRQRLWQWQQKALREAKLQSSWSAPNEAYERGVEAFLSRLLLSDEGRALRDAIGMAAQTIAPAGAVNSLAQTLLHLTVPGVPDVYQGDEFWDFSLVDPDNRRPVDFNARQHALNTSPDVGELLSHWRDGRIKQALIAQVLAMRKAEPERLRSGCYTPLQVIGKHAQHVVAFCRESHGKRMLVVVPRWPHRLLENSVLPHINAQVWGDTRVKLPFACPTQNWKGLFHTGAVTPDKELLINAALGDFPVNVFINPDIQES
ncbi:malto-oligosyltrehalose synthase [Pseudomonas sp. MWU15-20650]|uniref:malto-oligosyltrehalose synthase n=1 Tax=Pseudomonas sp. MWU15-20650 TaxID=2933107 RepID=UPI0020109DFE|nr:malto-oligosyltrehalose synthase [Pseudomonas sp. MWU15-20650]